MMKRIQCYPQDDGSNYCTQYKELLGVTKTEKFYTGVEVPASGCKAQCALNLEVF